MTSAPRYAPFVYVFVPFAILLTVANLIAEGSANLTFSRVQYTILVSAAFALPAVVLFFSRDLSTAPPLFFRYWQLTWVFGFIAYALHFYFAMGVWFNWDFSQVHRRQGLVVLTANCTLLALWGLDAVIALFGPGAGGRVGLFVRWAAHVLFVVAFVTAAVVFRSNARTMLSLAFGVAFIIASVGSLTFRWIK